MRQVKSPCYARRFQWSVWQRTDRCGRQQLSRHPGCVRLLHRCRCARLSSRTSEGFWHRLISGSVKSPWPCPEAASRELLALRHGQRESEIVPWHQIPPASRWSYGQPNDSKVCHGFLPASSSADAFRQVGALQKTCCIDYLKCNRFCNHACQPQNGRCWLCAIASSDRYLLNGSTFQCSPNP